jgi:hypothetical protein
MTRKEDLELFNLQTVDNPYNSYFLLDNPFPGRGEKPGEVCTNQQEIKRVFANILQSFDTKSKRLRINGESGAGKTNILQYFDRLTEDARSAGRIGNIKPIYVIASVEDYIILHGQIVDELLKKTFTDLVNLLKDNRDKLIYWKNELQQANEVIDALFSIFEGTLFSWGYERSEDVFQRWLKGQKISTTDKKLIRIERDIGNPSLAIKYLQDYLQLLTHFNICDGIVLFIDEFEEVFESLPKAKQSRFAQDLRHLIDALEPTCFFVFATTPEPTDLMRYPALERRMGDAHLLIPIRDIEEATKYAVDYLKAGRELFMEIHNETKLSENELNELLPLDENDILNAFENAIKVTKRRLNSSETLPGDFLPELRRIIKEKVEGQS